AYSIGAYCDQAARNADSPTPRRGRSLKIRSATCHACRRSWTDTSSSYVAMVSLRSQKEAGAQRNTPAVARIASMLAIAFRFEVSAHTRIAAARPSDPPREWVAMI